MKNSMSICFVGIILMAMIYNASSECVSLPEEMMEALDECRKHYFVQRLFGDSKRGCIAACILTKTNFMVDGKINVENIHKFFDENIKDSGLAQRVNERMHHSAMRANTGKDKCEAAGVFVYSNDMQEKQEPLMYKVFC